MSKVCFAYLALAKNKVNVHYLSLSIQFFRDATKNFQPKMAQNIHLQPREVFFSWKRKKKKSESLESDTKETFTLTESGLKKTTCLLYCGGQRGCF